MLILLGMALGRRQHYNSDLRDKERNSLGTEWKTENDCIGSHVFYICAPSLRKKSRIVKTAGAEWKEEITNMFPDFTVAWETLGFLRPVSGLQKVSGLFRRRWY